MEPIVQVPPPQPRPAQITPKGPYAEAGIKMSGFTLGRDGFGSFAVVSDFKSSISQGIQGVTNTNVQIIKTCDDLDCGPVYDSTFSDTRRQSSSFLIVDFRVVSEDAVQVASQMGQAAFLTAFAERMNARGFDVSAAWSREPIAIQVDLGSSEAPRVDPLIILAISVGMASVCMVSAAVVYYHNMQKKMYRDRFETPFAFTLKGNVSLAPLFRWQRVMHILTSIARNQVRAAEIKDASTKMSVSTPILGFHRNVSRRTTLGIRWAWHRATPLRKLSNFLRGRETCCVFRFCFWPVPFLHW